MRVIILVALLASACAKQVRVDPAHMTRYEAATWAAIESPEGHIRIFVTDKAAQEAAIKELCQTHKYICRSPQNIGTIIEIERVRK